jgi:hypothetical protein
MVDARLCRLYICITCLVLREMRLGISESSFRFIHCPSSYLTSQRFERNCLVSSTMDPLSSALHGVAQGNVAHIVGAATLLGVAFHLSIRPIEFELIMFHFMAASVFAFTFLVYVLGFGKAVLFSGTFNTAVLGSIAVYRLAFHRCRQFPGPFAAKVTRFYAASLSAKNVKYYKELANMHDQYGDFVRTGMIP